MKKILTLLIAVSAITIVQAQSSRSYPNDRSTNRDVILGDRNDRSDRNDRYAGRYENNNRYSYAISARDRDRQMDRINRDFDKQVRRVERERRMRSSEKSYQIRRLEAQRRDAIREVWTRFQSRNNAHSDNHYNTKDRRW